MLTIVIIKNDNNNVKEEKKIGLRVSRG